MDMPMGHRPTVAVLTGDIVESSKLPEAVRRQLAQTVSVVEGRMAHSFPVYFPYALDFFRGDSWQWLVIPPGKSLRMAIFMRALLLNAVPGVALDTRISIGIGGMNSIPEGDLARADGEAFPLSGDLLAGFGRNDRLRVRLVEEPSQPLLGSLDMLARLIDLQVCQWTRKQAHAISGAILGFTQVETARDWFKPSISQQAVAQHLDRAGWATIEAGVDFFEGVVNSLAAELVHKNHAEGKYTVE
jgi:hypothetical protein